SKATGELGAGERDSPSSAGAMQADLCLMEHAACRTTAGSKLPGVWCRPISPKWDSTAALLV
ncbi:MAG: hypothetical protein N3C58_08515, partial [Meiothermus ruber]|nr:hypothetical protein [Meiothermus ruber]